MANSSTVMNISLVCDFTMNNSDCSYLFKEVHVSATILQALFSIVISIISVSTNLLLIASMVTYRNDLENSTILSISFLVANIIVSVFLNGEIFFTSLFRAWLIGYWGCKVVAFIITCGLFARWVTVSFISFDRFCRIFFALTYSRYSKKVVIVLTVTSWVISLVTAVIFFVTNAIVFAISLPGCLFSMGSKELSMGGKTVVEVTLWFVLIVAIFIPSLLYTAMYFKGRKIKQKIQPVSSEESDSPLSLEALIKANKASLIYFFMLLVFICVNIVIIVQAVTATPLLNMGVPVSALIPILFVLTTLTESYVLLDDVIILTNSQQRKAFFKMFIKTYNMCPCKWSENCLKIIELLRHLQNMLVAIVYNVDVYDTTPAEICIMKHLHMCVLASLQCLLCM